MWLVSAFRKCANKFCGVFMSVVIKVFTMLVINFVSTKFILIIFVSVLLDALVVHLDDFDDGVSLALVMC